MFKMNQLVVGLFLFLSSLFSCQQKGDFKTVNVEDFDSIIQDEEVQRLDVRTLAEYSEGHIAKTININVMDDSFASMADSLLQRANRLHCIAVAVNEARKLRRSLVKKDLRLWSLVKDSMPAGGRKGDRILRLLLYGFFLSILE